MKLTALLAGALLLAPRPAAAELPTLGSVVRHDPALDALLAPDARLEVIAAGFDWSEGPVWDKAGRRLLWSDVPANTIYQWSPEKEGHSVFLRPSGFTGLRNGSREPGSNGLAFDAGGRLLCCEHGDRRLSALTPGGGKITLADRYDGKRFNSPNDLCVHSGGAIFFTDPPYGLPKGPADPHRELPWCGVYRLDPDRTVTLLTKDLERPNGIALSPDERTLYVAQSHRPALCIFAFPLGSEGTLGERRTVFDCSELAARFPGSADGLKVDRDGNLWATGPGGVLVLTPDGKLLGHLLTGQRTANCAWGDDGATLYITADYYVCRVKTLTRGAGW